MPAYFYSPLESSTRPGVNFLILSITIVCIVTGVGLLVHYSSSPGDSITLLSLHSSSSSSSSSTGAVLSSSSSSSTGSNTNNLCAPGYNTIDLNSTTCYLPFLSTWNTSLAGSSNTSQITLPLTSDGVYNSLVDWGDNTTSMISSYTQSTHTYASPGVYTVNITGLFEGFSFVNSGDKLKLVEISQFGSLLLGDNGQNFWGCANLKITATDTLNLTGVTTLDSAFSFCTSLTSIPSINSWNTTYITVMTNMFNHATLFNSPLSNWSTSSVVDMSFMFSSCSSFNQPIGTWNTGAVTTMQFMFNGATSFSQSIAPWDVRQVTSMSSMFTGNAWGTANYNAALTSWAGETPLTHSVSWGVGTNKRWCNNTAYTALISGPNFWTITDSGSCI